MTALSIRKDAEADIAEAYDYYESCGAGLGLDLLLLIGDCLARISANPRQYKIVHGDIRRALIECYPYGIYYTIEDDLVVIIAVVHGRRSPLHWQKRH